MWRLMKLNNRFQVQPSIQKTDSPDKVWIDDVASKDKGQQGCIVNTHKIRRKKKLTSASPTFFFLMAYCRQWLRVRVSRRFVDLRIMSSISVELNMKNDLIRNEIHTYMTWIHFL